MPGIGVGVWLGSTRSHVPNPNGLKVGGSRPVRLWCSAHPSVGSWTLDSASVDPLSAGTPTSLQNYATGESDPDGGSDAYLLQETTDGGDTSHYVTLALNAHVGTWTDIVVWLAASPGGRDWYLLWGPTGNYGRMINASTGADAQYAADTITTAVDLGADAGGRWFRVRWRNVGVGGTLRIYSCNSTPTWSYTGDGRQCGAVYGVVLTQPRISGWYDKSLLPTTEVERGADAGQGTDDDQPGFGAPWTLVNGLAVPMGEDGRASDLEVTHADVVALGTGDDPQCGMMAVVSCEAGAQMFRFDGAGGEYQYLERNVNDLRLVRHDGASTSTKTFGSGLGSLLDTPQLLTLFGTGSRVWSLYIGDTHRADVTADDLSSATMTGSKPLVATGTGDIIMPEVAVFADLSSIGGHAAINAALMDQAGGNAFRDRWNV